MGAVLWQSVIFLAFFPASIIFVWRFFRDGFIDLLDTFILTAAVAVVTALFAFMSFLLSRRHRY